MANNRSHYPTIAVHFRGGDHYLDVRETNMKLDKRLEVTSLHQFISCADKIAGAGSQPPTIFLCADSSEVKSFAKKFYGERVYSSSVNPFHSDRAPNSSTSGDKWYARNGTLGSWADLLLLGMADGIVMSSSGYSVLASQIAMYSRDQIMTFDECFV